jgi:hypothetical protein
MRRKVSVCLPILVLLASCIFLLVANPNTYRWVGDMSYELSTWSQDDAGVVRLNFLGLIPNGDCLMKDNLERGKACVIGTDRYRRFNRPSE